MEVGQLRSADGRRLTVRMAGPQDGDVVLFHNGSPVDGPLFAPLVEAGAQRGLRHLSYSRPGYGDADRQPGRTVADCAADVSAIADALGIERLYTVGWSGGGPHALACAALLPDQVLGAATIASTAPWGAEGLDWLDGMGEENVASVRAAEAGEEEFRAYLEAEAEVFAAVTADQVLAALGDLVTEVDQLALTGEFAAYMAASMRAALRSGIWGWFDDSLAFMRDWGFGLTEIDVPISIWHGAEDRFVPFAHGQWLAENVAGAVPQLRPDKGHLSLAIASYGEILDSLIREGS